MKRKIISLLKRIRQYILRFIPDKLYISMLYRFIFKKKLNLNNPQGFNEKLQWLKLYNDNEKYTLYADKYKVREYIKDTIGEEYLIPLLGVYDKFSDIDFSKLPNQFVIKCNHDSGSVIICKDKNKFDFKLAKKKINRAMQYNYYYVGRERQYKNIERKILIEKYLSEDNSEIKDYKFFCFDGKAKMLYISSGLDNHSTASISFFDLNFKKLSIKRKDYNVLSEKIDRPVNFDKMIKFSDLLSKNIPHVRVDWYEINGKLYFGELTFFTCSGYIPFESEEDNLKLGKMLKLR